MNSERRDKLENIRKQIKESFEGIDVKDMAEDLGIPEEHLEQIIDGRRTIYPDYARKIEWLTDGKVKARWLWNNLNDLRQFNSKSMIDENAGKSSADKAPEAKRPATREDLLNGILAELRTMNGIFLKLLDSTFPQNSRKKHYRGGTEKA